MKVNIRKLVRLCYLLNLKVHKTQHAYERHNATIVFVYFPKHLDPGKVIL